MLQIKSIKTQGVKIALSFLLLKNIEYFKTIDDDYNKEHGYILIIEKHQPQSFILWL